MKEKIYHLLIFDIDENKIIKILSFHNLENAINKGKDFIKGWYKENNYYSLKEEYDIWEKTHTFWDALEISEDEFED